MRAQNVSGTVRVLCESDRNFKGKEKNVMERSCHVSRRFFLSAVAFGMLASGIEIYLE